MALYIEGLFLGVSKRADMKTKEGKAFSDRPMYQLLITESAGHIGYRSSIVNITIGTYGAHPDDAAVSELYQKYKDKYMKECKLSVSQYTKDNINYYSTESQPVFLEREKTSGVSSSVSPISNSQTPGQRSAALAAS